MRRVLFALGVAGLAFAQNQGEEVFNKTCGTGYCHGSKGVGGGAPRLAARGFEQSYINSTVTEGVPGTQMAAFGATLSRADLIAVVAYVASLNGVTPVTAGRAPARSAPALSAEATRGRVLFSEATRSFARCSTCHEVNRIGIAVTTPIAKVPANAAALKALATPAISTASVGGESMPILMVGRRSQSVTFYDLTIPPPVLRTVAPTDIRTTDGSSWRHSSVLGTYSDTELGSILAYLRATLQP